MSQSAKDPNTVSKPKVVKDSLTALRQKEAEIRARIQAIESRDKEADRKKDTRKKILIGGAMFAKVKRGEWAEKQMLDFLGPELKADRDRALFDLKLLPKNEAPDAPKS